MNRSKRNFMLFAGTIFGVIFGTGALLNFGPLVDSIWWWLYLSAAVIGVSWLFAFLLWVCVQRMDQVGKKTTDQTK